MNYGDLRTQLIGLINRDDLTETQADVFLVQGISRVQRTLRVPTMERIASLPTDADGYATIPAGYLSMKDGIFVESTGTKLKKLELGQFLTKGITGLSQFYVRYPTQFRIKDNPGVTTTDFTISYYAEFQPLVVEDDEDPLLDAAFDIFLYACAVFAADYFIDDRKAGFETSFQQFLGEVMTQAGEQETSEGYTTVSAGTDTEF